MAEVVTGRVAVGSMSRVVGGRIGTVGRIGSIGHLGSVTFSGSIDRIGYVARIGSLARIGSITRIGSVANVGGGRIGTLGYLQRVGTVGHVGSSPYVGSVNRLAGGRLGSLGYLQRLGTVGHVGSSPYVGSVNRIGGGRIGSNANNTGSTYIQGQRQSGTVLRQNIGLGRGSTWVGSWQNITDWPNKTWMILSLGGTNGGSISIVNGLTGTTQTRMTGTYYGPTRVGAGSVTSLSFREAYQFSRPVFRMSGQRRGTLYVGLGRSGL